MQIARTTVDDDGVVYKTFEAFFKTPYNHDRDAESSRTATYCQEPTLAQQHSKEEADINTIVRNFGITGHLPQVQLPPTYEEFSEVFDFQSAMNQVLAARQSFDAMPAEVRDAFHNDPARFVGTVDAFLAEPDQAKRAHNMTLLRGMGLAVDSTPADRTTLGDVLKAIKEQGTPKAPPVANTPETGS